MHSTHKKNKRLFWFNDISDDMLQPLYSHRSCLLATSYAEGFDLPLIKAQAYQLPVLARNIEVFREILGENAMYFDADNAIDLAAPLM